MQLKKEVKSNPNQPSCPSQPFLSRHLGFHIFFHYGRFWGHTLFLQLGYFGLDDYNAVRFDGAI